jgi:hypothetical protein
MDVADHVERAIVQAPERTGDGMERFPGHAPVMVAERDRLRDRG